MLDKYAKALDEKDNTIKSLQSVLVLRYHEINIIKEERILAMMIPRRDCSYMPDDKKALTDNEIPDGINSIVLKEIHTLQRQYTQVREDRIVPDILPSSTDHIWNQVVNTEVAQQN